MLVKRGKLLQYLGDGGCFSLHYDSDDSVDARRVTAILYQNFGWRPSHGGELQLFPWPYPPVTIQPLYNRMVIFHATRMLHRSVQSSSCPIVFLSALHESYCMTLLTETGCMCCRVLPSFAERFCLTVWMSVLKPDLPSVPALLINKGAQCFISRESHPACQDCEVLRVYSSTFCPARSSLYMPVRW